MRKSAGAGPVGRPRLTPTKAWLRRAYRDKLTYDQMVREWERETGVRVTSVAMRSAASREDVAGTRTPRYSDYLPWTMRSEHQNAPEARALRVAKRRSEGLPNSTAQDRALDVFLSQLDARNAVIYYDRGTDQGWWWVERPSSLDAVDAGDPDTLRLRELPG